MTQQETKEDIKQQDKKIKKDEISDTQCTKCGNTMHPKTLENDKKVFFCAYCNNQKDFSELEVLSITRYNKNIKQQHFSPSIRYDPTYRIYEIDCEQCKNNTHKGFLINSQQLVLGFMCTKCANVMTRKQQSQKKS